MSSVDDKRFAKEPSSQKAKERYEQILDCADQLLQNKGPWELGIPEVAKTVGLPPQAVYRLFPSAAALTHGLATRHMNNILLDQKESDFSQATCWQDALAIHIDSSAQYYQRHPQAMELIFGTGVSRESQAANRANNVSIVHLAIAMHSPLLNVNVTPELILRAEIAVDLSDSVFASSYFSHQNITPFYIEEAKRVVVGYLEQYLPRYCI